MDERLKDIIIEALAEDIKSLKSKAYSDECYIRHLVEENRELKEKLNNAVSK